MTRTSGVVLVDKPAGWTSHDVVAKLRGILRQRRIGHAGTLDPMATGLLVIAVGSATRLLRFATETTKTYTGTVQFGSATDSLDADGVVVATKDVPPLSVALVQAAATQMLGPQQQIPPMVSAIKIDGKKLYELAREGKEVERPARDIVVHSFTVSPTDSETAWNFEVVVTPGTYVRVLLADLAERLETLGHLTALRRTANGASSVVDALSLEEIQRRVTAGEVVLAAPLEMVKQYPVAAVDTETVAAIRQGKVVDLVDVAESPYVAATDVAGELVAVLRPRQGRWQPDVVLANDAPSTNS